MFANKRKKGMKTPQCQNYQCFKRMLAVKDVVYQHHNKMFRLYERYCFQASIKDLYFNDDDNNDSSGVEEERAVVSASETNEADCDDGF